ncbi:hypothetical protein [Rheinheimera tilapiae]|jgi:hypothetical protein|uniref:Uncharacterized protein n=1 Tax=Rheinheimera tilapiae TaxID=875043 RepID=A0ABV6B8E5_9GAMM
MTNCIYVEYDKFIVILTLISNLKAPTHNFQKHQEIRIFAQRNQDFMSIQTHTTLQPAIVVASLKINNKWDGDLDITVSAEPMLKCLNGLDCTSFVKLTLEDSRLRIQPAMYTNDIFNTDDFSEIQTASLHHVIYQPTKLITDYSSVTVDQSNIFYCRNNLLETFKCIKAYAMSSKKQKKLQVILSSDASTLFIDLVALDISARLRLLEHELESDTYIRLNSEQLNYLTKALALLLNSKLGPVEMSVGNQSQLVLTCQGISCELSQRDDFELMEQPIFGVAKKGWCVDSNWRLQQGLKQIVVTTRPSEDIVEIQMIDGQIHLLQLTEYASGSFHTDVIADKGATNGPAVVVNRDQLFSALACFNSYEKLKIHGLLSREERLLIRPSSNEDEFVMLAITEPLDVDHQV